jgi:hypothetical protein
MRRRFVGLVLALAGLLIVGGCNEWMLSGCGLQPECHFEKFAEVASPVGSYRAVSGVNMCNYKGRITSVQTTVIVTGATESGFRLGPAANEPKGSTVFYTYEPLAKGEKPKVSASDIGLSWRSNSELVVTYPAGIRLSCDPPDGIKVHCVERGFASSAAPRALR